MLGDIDWPAAGRRSFTSKIDLASKNPLAQARGRRGPEEDDGWAQGRAVRLQAQGSRIRPRGIAFLSGQLTLSDPRGRSNAQGTRSSKKKKPTFYQQKPSQDNMGFPGGEGAPVTGPGQAASWRGGSSRPATGAVSPSSRRGTRPDSGTRHYLPRW